MSHIIFFQIEVLRCYREVEERSHAAMSEDRTGEQEKTERTVEDVKPLRRVTGSLRKVIPARVESVAIMLCN